jgi:predicted permease
MAMQLRHVIRRFLRAPLFTAVAIGTLGLGIGATTAMYAVVDGILLEPLPYPDPGQLVGVWHEAPGLGFDELNQGPAFHWTYRQESQVFEDVAMWSNTRLTVTGLAEPEQVPAVMVTAGGLELLGARPVIGRLFLSKDDAPGAPLTTILSYGYWQQRLGGAPDAVGRTITVSGRAREIIGVLPRGFRFIESDPALLIPYQLDEANLFLGNFSHFGFARLRAGFTIAQANADVERMIDIATERYMAPGGLNAQMLEEARFAANVRPLEQDVIGDVANVLWVLLGTVAIVLLIACANVANLFLVRAEGRYREVAVRTALGASRRRIANEFLTESLTLAAISGIVAVALAIGALRLLRTLSPQGLPRLQDITLDASVLAVAAAITLLAGIFLGLIPVARHARIAIAGALREGGRGGSAGRDRHRMRSALATAQLALALVLLAGSGLMVRTMLAMRDVNPGFEDPENVLTMRLSIPGAEVPEPAMVAAMHERIMSTLDELPGVASVGMSSSITMDGNTSADPIFSEDHPMPPNTLPPIRRYKWISPNYFATMETPILAGRDVTWDDIRQHRRIAIISENLAVEYWGSPQGAIGRRIRNVPERPWREIVGVVADVRDDGVDQPAPAIAHWPMLQDSLWDDGLQAQNTMSYALRLDRQLTPALMDQIRQAVWSINPNLPLARVETLDRILADSMARTSFTLVMLAIAAAVALLLGAVGLYGVISYIVSQRTREFGVRLALGARAGDVGTMVVREAAILVGMGLTIGLVAAAALTRLMSALLYGVAPFDPLTFGAVAATLAAVAFIAAWLPARRAARVDPIEALRWE